MGKKSDQYRARGTRDARSVQGTPLVQLTSVCKSTQTAPQHAPAQGALLHVCLANRDRAKSSNRPTTGEVEVVSTAVSVPTSESLLCRPSTPASARPARKRKPKSKTNIATRRWRFILGSSRRNCIFVQSEMSQKAAPRLLLPVKSVAPPRSDTASCQIESAVPKMV